MMSHCVYCGTPLGHGRPSTTDAETGLGGDAFHPGLGAARQAYDPERGRLWAICPGCERWSPIPLELRWETLERWERLVRAEGRVLLSSSDLALIRVGEDEVVRVGDPSFAEWGGWRYGTKLPPRHQRRGFLARVLGSLPPPPLEGYDPYGFGGPMGGVSGRYGPSQWIASPFLEQAQPLTLAFTSVPFASMCPSCSLPMPINPWDLAHVLFHVTSGVVAVEADCGSCGVRVSVPLREVRPALRLGLAILDSGAAARALGEAAGSELDRIGGATRFLSALAGRETGLGELDRTQRVALGIALDRDAEAAALEAEWREAEEIAAIMDGELTDVPGFREFRARVLGTGA